MRSVSKRVSDLEQRLKFLMSVMQMDVAIPTKVLGPDGRPGFKKVKGNMHEIYALYRAMDSAELQSEVDPPALIDEKDNGTDTDAS